jgi:serine/threonine protein kinase
MHACGVRHGDIKAENVLLTSWNWLLISDLAPYKPVYVDLENPADFTYYFDTCGRRRCYLAPERFLQGKAAVSRRAQDLHVTSAMDVFATGCTVAEVITQEALFQYSDMASFVNTGSFSAATEVHLRLRLKPAMLIHSSLHLCTLTIGSEDPSYRRCICRRLISLRSKMFPTACHSSIPHVCRLCLRLFINIAVSTLSELASPATGDNSSRQGTCLL